MLDTQQFYQAVLDAAVDAIVIIDEIGVIQHCNASAERMFGYLAGELAGQNVSVLMPDPHRGAHDGYLRHHLRTGERKIIGIGREIEGRRKDGSPIQLHLGVSAVHVGARTFFAGILHDITKRKAAETRAAELARTLEEKNRELQSIVYVASHDLRTPLVNIQGFSQELARACSTIREEIVRDDVPQQVRERILAVFDGEVDEALGFILGGAMRMDALLSGLLRLSRLGRAALDIRPLDMNALVAGVRDALGYQLDGLDARVSIAPLPSCLGDEVQIAQVFTNLIDNAMKYRELERPLEITIEGERHAERAIYRVRDNGVGIAPHYRHRVFEIFHRLDAARTSGEGLGLTIAQRIVARLDGSISILDTAGPGTTFRIELPGAPDGAPFQGSK